jgi:hypothetical protein
MHCLPHNDIEGTNCVSTFMLFLWLMLQADLISTLLATDHIPCAVAGSTYTILRNNPAIDGKK